MSSSLISINPTSEKIISTYEEDSKERIQTKLLAAEKSFQKWKTWPLPERLSLLPEIKKLLLSQKDEAARLISSEMGKPFSQSLAEVEKSASLCDYYHDHAEEFLSDRLVKTDAKKSYVSFQPLGVILGVMPWNFPFWQVFRFVIPTIMAGNTVVVKHASNVTGANLWIENLFSKLPVKDLQLYQSLSVPGPGVKEIIENPLIKAISLTGSSAAGRSVAEVAGKNLKKVVLELGGSDAYVIAEDAELPKAIETCVYSRLINAGQSCISAKRFLFPRSIQKEVENLFVKFMSKKKMGDPFDMATDLGPLARKDLQETVHRQLEESIQEGAKVLLGGKIPSASGYFYPPSLLSEVHEQMTCFKEEIFGPVASLIPTKDLDEAIRLANQSPYGLGAAIFSKDEAAADRIARERLEAGSVFVNAFVRSDARLPFGGIKDSGYGRELSEFGIHEFVNIKTIWIS